MVSWDDLRYFLAVHRTGTLARAAALLDINATTVGRRLVALEGELDTRLFDRTPDGYVLTPAGRDLVLHAERMEGESLAIERSVAGADDRATGLVRVAVSEMLATRFIAPHIPALHRQAPGITIQLHCTNEIVSLARREADIALRLARPREEDVITKQLADIPVALYASTAYVGARGVPADPEASLAGHQVILFVPSRHFRIENEWMEARIAGAAVVLRSDSVSAIYSAALAGLGIALLPCAVADRDPQLVRIATESAPAARTIWQTIHRDLRGSARIRSVTDFLEKILTAPR